MSLLGFFRRNSQAKRAKELAEAMYRAEISYGCGFYSDDEWNRAYDELGKIFGLDKAWRDSNEHLHSERWSKE